MSVLKLCYSVYNTKTTPKKGKTDMKEINDAFVSTPQYEILIFGIFMLVLVIIAVIAIMVKERKDKFDICFGIIFMLFGVSLTIGCWFIPFIRDREKALEYGERRKEYSVYLDGVKVGYSDIKLSNYRKITYDDENQKIIVASNNT